jgi:hypothetical protein
MGDYKLIDAKDLLDSSGWINKHMVYGENSEIMKFKTKEMFGLVAFRIYDDTPDRLYVFSIDEKKLITIIFAKNPDILGIEKIENYLSQEINKDFKWKTTR